MTYKSVLDNPIPQGSPKSALLPEINKIVIGPYQVDLYICENGGLGITIERLDHKTNSDYLDIFAPEDLDYTKVIAG